MLFASYFLYFQFIRPPPKIPWKAILLATFLFSVGTILLVVGSLLFTGYVDVKVHIMILKTSINSSQFLFQYHRRECESTILFEFQKTSVLVYTMYLQLTLRAG